MLVASAGDEKPYRPKFTRKKLPTIADYVRDRSALNRLNEEAENRREWLKHRETSEWSTPENAVNARAAANELSLIEEIISSERIRLIEMLREIKRSQS